jgi:hypothetical protein
MIETIKLTDRIIQMGNKHLISIIISLIQSFKEDKAKETKNNLIKI